MNTSPPPPAPPSAADRDAPATLNKLVLTGSLYDAEVTAAVESQRVKDREELVKVSTRAALAEADRDRLAGELDATQNILLLQQDKLSAAQSRIAALEGELAKQQLKSNQAAIAIGQNAVDWIARAEAAERQLAEAQRELTSRTEAIDSLVCTNRELTQLAAQRAGETDELRQRILVLEKIELDGAKLLMDDLRAQLTQEQEAHESLRKNLEKLQWFPQSKPGDDQFASGVVVPRQVYEGLTLAQQRAECADRLAEALKKYLEAYDAGLLNIHAAAKVMRETLAAPPPATAPRSDPTALEPADSTGPTDGEAKSKVEQKPVPFSSTLDAETMAFFDGGPIHNRGPLGP